LRRGAFALRFLTAGVGHESGELASVVVHVLHRAGIGPERGTGGGLDLAKLGALYFEAPDMMRFPALRIALEALATGGSATTVLNAANEVAVQAFLARRIGFLAIAGLVEATLAAAASLTTTAPASVEEVLGIDQEARGYAETLLQRFA
jgi:1-deoxy-D-xylulose-5-phosphate reductoisomerase